MSVPIDITQTVRFKNELERNITIKLGYANAKLYRCDNPECPRPGCYKSYRSSKVRCLCISVVLHQSMCICFALIRA